MVNPAPLANNSPAALNEHTFIRELRQARSRGHCPVPSPADKDARNYETYQEIHAMDAAGLQELEVAKLQHLFGIACDTKDATLAARMIKEIQSTPEVWAAAVDAEGSNSLHWAIDKKHLAVAHAIVRKVSQEALPRHFLNQPNHKGETALTCLVKQVELAETGMAGPLAERVALAQDLVAAGADTSARDKEGRRPTDYLALYQERARRLASPIANPQQTAHEVRTAGLIGHEAEALFAGITAAKLNRAAPAQQPAAGAPDLAEAGDNVIAFSGRGR